MEKDKGHFSARVPESFKTGLASLAETQGLGKGELLPRMLDAYISLQGGDKFAEDLNQVNTALGRVVEIVKGISAKANAEIDEAGAKVAASKEEHAVAVEKLKAEARLLNLTIVQLKDEKGKLEDKAALAAELKDRVKEQADIIKDLREQKSLLEARAKKLKKEK